MAEENIQPSCSSIPDPAFTDFSEDENSDRRLENFTLLNGMVLEFCNEKKRLPWKEIADELKKEFCIEDSDCKGHDLSVYNKIQIVYTKLKALSGKKSQEFTPPSNLEGYLNFVLKDTPPKQRLRKKLLATKKENIGLKRKLNDSFEEIIETDEELAFLTQKYKTTVAILGNIEQNYGNVLNKLTKDSFDKDSLNKNLKLKLSELQEKYINTSEELEKAEEKIQKLKTKNLTKKLKQEMKT